MAARAPLDSYSCSSPAPLDSASSLTSKPRLHFTRAPHTQSKSIGSPIRSSTLRAVLQSDRCLVYAHVGSRHCVCCARATCSFSFRHVLLLPCLVLPCLVLSSGASTVLYCTQSALGWIDKYTDNSPSIYLSLQGSFDSLAMRCTRWSPSSPLRSEREEMTGSASWEIHVRVPLRHRRRERD